MEKFFIDDCRLQFISHQTDRISYLEGIHSAITGLCRWIQIRMKDASDDEVRHVALKAKYWCKMMGAKLILDDRVLLAKELGVDGVHLGKNDMPIAEARRILGDGFIIGGTANTFDDIKAHAQAGADYIGCGPFRYTTTKKNLSPILGLDGYRHIVAEMHAHHIDLPIVAIGGITPADIPDIMKTGVTGIALSGAILNADDPAVATHNILEIIQQQTDILWKN